MHLNGAFRSAGLAQFTVVRTSTDWSVAASLDGVTLLLDATVSSS